METKRITRRFLELSAIAVLAIALAFAALAQPAFADDSSSSAAASQSAASPAASLPAESPSATDVPLGGLPMMGNDYVWFGRDFEVSGVSIGNDVIAAGQIINIKSCTAGGDYRLAGQDITIRDSMAGENITAAGQTVIIKDSIANAIAAAGQGVSFSGTCDTLTIFAEKVYIDGTVSGNVVVGANSVEVGTNARIAGTLYVSAPSDPVMQRGAEVANVEYTKTEKNTSPAPDESSLAGLSTALTIFIVIMSILGTLIVAVLAEWLFRRQTAGAAAMIKERTGALIGTGIVGAIAAPIAVILLICFGITLPVAGGVAFALFAITAVANGFAGTSLFKLVFPNLGRFKCALIGGAIVGIASAIPILGNIVGVLSFMYLLGYVLQSIFLGMRDPEPAMPLEPVTAAVPITSVAPVAPVTPAASVAPVAPIASAASAAPATPVAEPTMSVEPVASATPTEPVEPVTPAASTEPVEPAVTAEPSEPVEQVPPQDKQE